MRTKATIDEAVARVLAVPPAPVILADTCSFLDLFRADESAHQPRVPSEELSKSAELLALVASRPAKVHLFVPELVPREYTDHAGAVQARFEKWTEWHDQNQQWLADASSCVALPLPAPFLVHPHNLAAKFRALADALLANAEMLERDQACLDRAVDRLVRKRRPSHNKEMKDSMNLEQCLELSSRLANANHSRSCIWISSNIRDFAHPAAGAQLHVDLQPDFDAARLKYFTSFGAALGRLRSANEI
jgi:hypothetical protein